MKTKLATIMFGLVIAVLTVIGFSNQTIAATGTDYDTAIASVDSASGAFSEVSGKNKDFFLRRLTVLKKNLTDAKAANETSNKRGVSTKLKNAMATIRGILQRLNSHTGRAKIQEPLRTDLVNEATQLKTLVTNLKKN